MERFPGKTSIVSGGDGSPRIQEFDSPNSRTTSKVQESLPGDRSPHDRHSFNISDAGRTGGSPRSKRYRYPISPTTGLAYDKSPGDQPAHSQSTAKFELESSSQQTQYTRRRHRRKPPGDVEKGGKELDNDEGLDRLVTDGEVRTSSPTSPRPWLSHIEGREDIIVAVSNAAAKEINDGTGFEGRWTNIESEDMSFQKFKAQVMQIPSLDDDDLELVDELVNEIQRTREKQFVHGRYLDPVAKKLVYLDEDLESKSAMFVSLPAFSTQSPKTPSTKRESEGHPVRALLQSRYHLESTDRRDKLQVTAHHSNGDRVMTVPQIWALVINNHTVITCAPLETSVLLGETIKTKPYPPAEAPIATGSVFFSDIKGNAFRFTDLHFTDPHGQVSCIPLALCRTWFGLLKQIVEVCLDDESDSMREKIKKELLNGRPSFQLRTKEETLVTIDSWLQIMKKNRTGIIHMRLEDRQEMFKPLLVTHHREETFKLDVTSDATSSIRHDRGNDATESSTTSISDSEVSETSVSSTASTTVEGKNRKLASKLCSLRAELQEAKAQVDWGRVLAISQEIPVLEYRILEWTAENLRSELRGKEDTYEEAKGTHVASHGPRRRPRSSLMEASSRTSSEGSSSESSSRSGLRLRLRSTSRLQIRKRSVPGNDLSTRSPKLREYSGGLKTPHENSRDVSSILHGRHHGSFRPLHSGTRRRERSYTHGVPSLSRTPLQSPSFQSPWDTIRSHFLTRHPPSRAPPAPLTPTGEKPLRVQESTMLRKRNEEVSLENRPNGTRPKLRQIVVLARKAAAMFPNLKTAKVTKGTSTLFLANGTGELPIFLWPLTQKPSMTAGSVLISPRSKSVEQRAPSRSFSVKLDAEPTNDVNASRMKELQTLLAEMHENLKKPRNPRKSSREHATFYERTVGRSAVEARSLIVPVVRDHSEKIIDRTKRTMPLDQEIVGRVAGERHGQNTSFAGTSTVVTESHASHLNSRVLDLASKLFHAFIPEDYDAAIITKYWGAVHKLLRQDVHIVFLDAQQRVTETVASHLTKLDKQVRSIQLGMRTNDGSQPVLCQLPDSFIRAFQQLLMLFVVAGNMAEICASNVVTPHFAPQDRLQTIFEDCSKRLVQARMEIVKSIHRDDHDGSAGSTAIHSQAMLSLILANLLYHSSESKSFSLTKTYRDYTTKLRSLVRNRAYVRVHHHIPLLIEELDVIRTTLEQQYCTLSNYQQIIDVNTPPNIPHLSLTVVEDLLRKINQRSRHFEELLIEAQSAHAQSSSLKSESNNKAILVFTVTTIIFLPLSFVTSYLGMNTSDLRNMQSGQMLFWAIGAPVAFVVFGTALAAAYYGEARHRATRLYRRGKDKFE